MRADVIVDAVTAALVTDPAAHAWAVRHRDALLGIVADELADARTRQQADRLVSAMTPEVTDAFRAASLTPSERMTIRSIVTAARSAAAGSRYYGLQSAGAALTAALAANDPHAVRHVADRIASAFAAVSPGEAPNVDVAWDVLTTYRHVA